MEGLTIQELIAMGGDTPLLALIAYFMWKLERNFVVLATQIQTALRMPGNDDDE